MRKINLLLSLLPLAAISASASPVPAETLHFPYYPSLSPDGTATSSGSVRTEVLLCAWYLSGAMRITP